MDTTIFTKEVIQNNIKTNLGWMVRTIEVLYNRQTLDEQNSGQTNHLNGMGFNGRDSVIFTSFYNQIQKRKQYGKVELLSLKQIEICQKSLPKYWKQVLEEIKTKSETKVTIVSDEETGKRIPYTYLHGNIVGDMGIDLFRLTNMTTELSEGIHKVWFNNKECSLFLWLTEFNRLTGICSYIDDIVSIEYCKELYKNKVESF